MVHALEEAARVLVANGPLLDVRPMATDCEILAIRGAERVPVATLDQSPGVPDDVATRSALEEVLRRRIFRLEKRHGFHVDFYWRNGEELAADIEENWKRRGTPVSTVDAERATSVTESLGEGARLRLRMTMTAAVYRAEALQ